MTQGQDDVQKYSLNDIFPTEAYLLPFLNDSIKYRKHEWMSQQTDAACLKSIPLLNE